MVYTLGKPFPRIPLSLKLADKMPDIQRLMNYSVQAELDQVQAEGNELELTGRYTINMKYYGMKKQTTGYNNDDDPAVCQCFFSNLRFNDVGYLCEKDDDQQEEFAYAQVPGLFAYSWQDEIHTFVEMSNPRYAHLPLALKVVRCEVLVRDGGRGVEGYLVLNLDRL